MPELRRLRLKRGDEMRVAVAQRVHGNAAGEVEIASTVGADQPAPSPLSKERSALAKTGNRWDAALLVMTVLPVDGGADRRLRGADALQPETKRAAFPGGT